MAAFSFSPPDPFLAIQATPLYVYKVVNFGGPNQMIPMPNCWVEQIDTREGPSPAVCRISYILDDRATAFGWPSQFDQLFPINKPPSPYAFVNDDQVLVIALIGGFDPVVMFTGFAQSPQVDITGRTQQVTFIALANPIRAWDTPIDYRVQRHNFALDLSVVGDGVDGSDVGTDTFVSLKDRVVFNPDRVFNCLPVGAVYEDDGLDSAHPVFADPALNKYSEDAHAGIPTPWTLLGFVQYLLWVYNGSEDWVKNPSAMALSNLLISKIPNNDSFFDPNDDSTYTAQPIVIPHDDVTGTMWPEALHRQLAMHGFEMTFVVVGSGPDAQTNLVIYRRDQAGPYYPKDVYLPNPGLSVEAGYANASAIHLAWDLGSVRNAVSVEMKRQVFESSFILAPNFKPGPKTDAVPPGNIPFQRQENNPKFNPKAYREFVVAEGNSVYWDYSKEDSGIGGFAASTFYDNNAPGYFGPQASAFVDPIKDLLQVDASGGTMSATLEVWRSQGLKGGIGGKQIFGRDDDFNSPPLASVGPPNAGGVEPDGTPTVYWDPIENGWELLDGRLGIRITTTNPEGLVTKSGAKIPVISGAGVISSDPNAYMFRLTIAYLAPERVPVYAGMRPSSPMIYPRWVQADRQDIDQVYAQKQGSVDQFNVRKDGTPNPSPKYVVDDFADATAEAAAIRSRGEFPPLSGSITIPTLSLAYQIGDRIANVNGRNISLRSNIGDQREAPQYPYVVGITWGFSGESQTTTLVLSDRREEGFRPSPMPRPSVAGALAGGLAAVPAPRRRAAAPPPRHPPGAPGDPNLRRRGQPRLDPNLVGPPEPPGARPPERDRNVIRPPREKPDLPPLRRPAPEEGKGPGPTPQPGRGPFVPRPGQGMPLPPPMGPPAPPRPPGEGVKPNALPLDRPAPTPGRFQRAGPGGRPAPLPANALGPAAQGRPGPAPLAANRPGAPGVQVPGPPNLKPGQGLPLAPGVGPARSGIHGQPPDRGGMPYTPPPGGRRRFQRERGLPPPTPKAPAAGPESPATSGMGPSRTRRPKPPPPPRRRS